MCREEKTSLRKLESPINRAHDSCRIILLIDVLMQRWNALDRRVDAQQSINISQAVEQSAVAAR